MKAYTNQTLSNLREEFKNTFADHLQERERYPSFERIKNSITYEVDYREALIQETPDLSLLGSGFLDATNPYEQLACNDFDTAMNKLASIESGNWSWEDIEDADKMMPTRESLINTIKSYAPSQHAENPQGLRTLYDQYNERLQIDVIKDAKQNVPKLDI